MKKVLDKFKIFLQPLEHIVAELEVNSVKTQKAFFAGISEGKIGQPEKTACGDVCPSQILSTCRMSFWFVSADSLGPTLASKLIWKVTTPFKNVFRPYEIAKTPYFQRFLVRCTTDF